MLSRMTSIMIANLLNLTHVTRCNFRRYPESGLSAFRVTE